MVDKKGVLIYNNSCVAKRQENFWKEDSFVHIGVWLSLARAPGLGPGSRRFESCHPDSKNYARVAQWWSIALPRRGSRVRIPSRAREDLWEIKDPFSFAKYENDLKSMI